MSRARDLANIADGNITGSLTLDGLILGDNDKAIFGASNNLQIYSDGANSRIEESGSGSLIIKGTQMIMQSATGENLAYFTSDGAATLYHNNSPKIATTSGGIDVTGSVTADGAIIQNSSAAGTQIVIENTSAATSTDYKIVGGKVGVSNEGFSIYDSANATTAYYIDSSGNHEFLGGNVGIGTTSPTKTLTVHGSDGTPLLLQGSGNDTAIAFAHSGTTNAAINSSSDGAIEFRIGGAGLADEAMRINASGNLLVGKTTTASNVVGAFILNNGLIRSDVDGGVVNVMNRKTSDGDIAVFQKDGTTVGSIGVFNADMVLGNTDTGLIFNDSSDAIYPWNVSTNAGSDALINLGLSNRRFKDLYLSGTATATAFVGDGSGLTGLSGGAVGLTAVGSFILGRAGSVVGIGQNIAGSNLYYANAGNTTSNSRPNTGTWRCHGFITSSNNLEIQTTVWQRIS